ncbi:hypothetical protein GH741_09400 [Aquibacillus halophilus]|uniref:Uncharacterized protein n=1 Tax=Aquibacillus halophilus TaxID=930132 RepID=A0A6A8DGQ9_9BACI|nr:hypothetical protein [Aquibacillus halophilus]MRH42901.1 hypothetical protein [Aquibacillus halophilus]
MSKNIYLFSLLFLFITLSVDAAPDPDEVERIKGNSSLQVEGEVITDKLHSDVEGSYPSQVRKMQLKIKEVTKQPTGLTIGPEDTLSIFYSYVPSWVQLAGGEKMDIIVGDEIEIWLEKYGNSWKPALSGETVNHLVKVEPRKEPIPEPFSNKLKQTVQNNTGYIVLGGIIVLVFYMGLLIRKFMKFRLS